MSDGRFRSFDGVWLLAGLRTPMGDYNGAFADAGGGIPSACVGGRQGMALLIENPDGC